MQPQEEIKWKNKKERKYFHGVNGIYIKIVDCNNFPLGREIFLLVNKNW